MAFPKSAQSRGGQAPASALQKQVARQSVRKHQPWKKSTGARSPLGKIIARYNAVQPGTYKRFVRSWEEDFERGCREAEQAIAAFEEDRALHPFDYDSLKVKRYQGQDTGGNQWCLFVVYAVHIGTEETIQDRIAVAQSIRQRFGGFAKRVVDRALLYEMPSWALDCLTNSKINQGINP